MADNKTSTAKLEAPGRPPVSSSSSLSTSSISSSSLANGTESSNNLKSRPIGAKLTPPGGHRYRRRSGQYKPSPKPPHVVPHYFRNRLATLSQIGEDWLYLALLGTIMALLSFSMDSVITLFLNTRLRLYRDVSEDSILVQYLGWTVTPIVLVSFSTGFVHLCSPTVSIIKLSKSPVLSETFELTQPKWAYQSITGDRLGHTGNENHPSWRRVKRVSHLPNSHRKNRWPHLHVGLWASAGQGGSLRAHGLHCGHPTEQTGCLLPGYLRERVAHQRNALGRLRCREYQISNCCKPFPPRERF